jgi:sugar diacid utilization regulator
LKLEKQLYSLINSTRVLTSTRDFDLVLQRLMEEVFQVIDAADAGVLFIYDRKKGGLVAKSSVGFDDNYLKLIILSENEAMTGKTFSSKKSIIFSNLPDTSEAMSDLSQYNSDLYIKALGKPEYPTSTICTPLIFGEECIGVLTIDSYVKNINFTIYDLHILETFANQAMIAIDNAKLFSQNERANQIHSKLSKVSLLQKGLKEITVTLSKLINKKVCILNDFFDYVSSCSETTKSLAIKLKQSNIESLKYALKQEEFTQKSFFLDGSGIDVFFFPIKAVTSQIGLLMIFVENEDELDPLDIFAVEHAIILFALEMTSKERFITDQFKYEGFLLQQLMQDEFDILDNQAQIYFSEIDCYIFVKVEMRSKLISFDEINLQKQAFSRLLYRELNYFEFKALVLEQNIEFNLLFIIKNLLNEKQIIEKIKLFFSKIILKGKEASNLDILIGIGRVFNRLHHIDESLYDSNMCINYIKLKGDKQNICSHNELGINRLLLNVNPLELKNYVREMLDDLIHYDQKNGTELLPTLKAYFDCDQNMKKTAVKCYVHLNTIKYRMQSIRKILNLDNISGERKFQLQLALYIYEFPY